MIGCVENQHTTKDGQLTHSGLQIDNGTNHGLNYTDSIGSKFSYRYMPVTITNDSIVPIHIRIDLTNEYDYPNVYGNQKFRLFLLPKELMRDKVTYDSVSYEIGDNEIRDFFDRDLNPSYSINKTIKPGKKCVITIGTLYPRPAKISGVVPNTLFALSDGEVLSTCDRLMKGDQFANSRIGLGLKLDFRESCMIIHCGQISYPKP